MFQSAWDMTAAPVFPALPVFNSAVFQKDFSHTVQSLAPVVKAAAKAGRQGKTVAVTSMASIINNPCEKSAAPGCVTP
jgi:hypothetical protein